MIGAEVVPRELLTANLLDLVRVVSKVDRFRLAVRCAYLIELASAGCAVSRTFDLAEGATSAAPKRPTADVPHPPLV
jgi:hypothetical protein